MIHTVFASPDNHAAAPDLGPCHGHGLYLCAVHASAERNDADVPVRDAGDGVVRCAPACGGAMAVVGVRTVAVV